MRCERGETWVGLNFMCSYYVHGGFSAVREMYFLCTHNTMHGISGIVSADAVMPALAFSLFPLRNRHGSTKSAREYIIMYSSLQKETTNGRVDGFPSRYKQSVCDGMRCLRRSLMWLYMHLFSSVSLSLHPPAAPLAPVPVRRGRGRGRGPFHLPISRV